MNWIKGMIDKWQGKKVTTFSDYMLCEIPFFTLMSIACFFIPVAFGYLFSPMSDSDIYLIELSGVGLMFHIVKVICLVTFLMIFAVIARFIWWQRITPLETPIQFRTLRKKIKETQKFKKWYEIILFCSCGAIFMVLYFLLYDIPFNYIEKRLIVFSSCCGPIAVIFIQSWRNRKKEKNAIN